MKIIYDEESDYGQQILQIMAELASLMDEDKLYTKTEICSILIKVKNYAYNLKDKVRNTPAVDDFFIDRLQTHIAFLEEQAKEGSY